ncbi:hypothetical protein [Pseudoduganella violaceinigra]|uniref:hypothetical protein n=1 Tax=Pseudoduganella violaceinigra TaxID=246602 RepID=UPI0004286E9F|nr:hypothetical protein [Pseudoduganella violaceinigra]
MNKLKTAILVAAIGMGFGISYSVSASPGWENCQIMKDECAAGDAAACRFFRTLCHGSEA